RDSHSTLGLAAQDRQQEKRPHWVFAPHAIGRRLSAITRYKSQAYGPIVGFSSFVSDSQFPAPHRDL
ncbi:MAG: hypothetical protein MPJ25_09090, partial [Pirellulales bacterium]|nr:hypothetical protein [Pirellulales bacterium]